MLPVRTIGHSPSLRFYSLVKELETTTRASFLVTRSCGGLGQIHTPLGFIFVIILIFSWIGTVFVVEILRLLLGWWCVWFFSSYLDNAVISRFIKTLAIYRFQPLLLPLPKTRSWNRPLRVKLAVVLSTSILNRVILIILCVFLLILLKITGISVEDFYKLFLVICSFGSSNHNYFYYVIKF